MLIFAFPRRRYPSTLSMLLFALAAGTAGRAGAQSEAGRICEVKPEMRCLDKAKIEGDTIFVPLDAAAIRSDGFTICDSSFNYTTAPDIVLVMDNTASMDSIQTVDGIPRYCEYPASEKGDPGCISGDPHKLRGPALRTFLDSAVVKGGKGINVGIVTFADVAEATSDKLLPLNTSTVDSIKSSIVMEAHLATNYNAAFLEARRLLAASRKPKAEQFIIFVSDGRPNRPLDKPYAYKAYWDSLPTVHSIFLGDNEANFADMQDISEHTHGTFFHIRDVAALAGYLTNNLAKELFRRATPTRTTVRNLTDSAVFQVDAAHHVALPDSGAYALQMQGPLELVKGVNDIVVKTEYGYGGTTQDVHFSIARAVARPGSIGLEQTCRALPQLTVYNSKDEDLAGLGKPFTIADANVRYVLTTNNPIDSFNVLIQTKGGSSAQQDAEASLNTAANRKDSSWTGSKPFEHQTVEKRSGDGKVQTDHGEIIIVSYHNPYIREDSASVRVRVKYGPDFDKAAYRDLDGDGRIETVTIRFLDALPTEPDKLSFKIVDAAGASAERTATAAAGEIKFAPAAGGGEDHNALIVTLSKPFPYGMTSVANADSSGRTYRQAEIPMVDSRFRVDDSVPPVIVSAEVSTDKTTGQPKILVTYSEPVKLAEPALEPLVFKRDTLEFTGKDLPIGKIEKVDDRHWVFWIESGTVYKPVGGDSVAINNNGETRDSENIPPKRKTYSSMRGPAPGQQISGFFVTFANESRGRAAAGSGAPGTGVVFIPVDSKGYPVPGDPRDGKCPDCSVQENGLFSGSVINIHTKQPVRYDFTIYTNMGQVVVHGSGSVSESDLQLLDKIESDSHDPSQTQYKQRIVWTGRTDDGMVAGTGVYVLKAVFNYDRNLKTGARASSETKLTKFGFMRECCQAYNDKWYY
jgi:hypothetical protein